MRITLAVALLAGCGGKGGVEKIADEKGTVTALAASDRGVAWVTSGEHTGSLVYWSGGKSQMILNQFAFHIALSETTIYWTDLDHLWSATLDGASRTQLVEESEITGLTRAGDTLYYVSKDKVGRAGMSGGNEVLFTLPPDAKQSFVAIAASGSTIVAATHGFAADGKQLESSLWRIDGEAKQLDRVPKATHMIVIDGSRIVWGLSDGTVAVPLEGGTRTTIAAGTLVAVGKDAVYVSETDRTLAIGSSGQRRIGPRCGKGALAGSRLYCHFSGDTVGFVTIGK